MESSDRLRGALRRAATRAALRGASPDRTTSGDLRAWARGHLGARRFVVVSNREPYSHVRDTDGVRVVRNAGGLTVALDAVARALGGTWVAHGSGNAARESVDVRDHVRCPPGHPAYTLRRVWLDDEDHDRYYAGFSNSALWPLCHIVYVRPRFRAEDWERYRDVNRRFAEAVLEEIGDEPALVFVQDYHLALVAQHLKAARPDLQVALFWHIPWPNAEVFRRLPWRAELIEGLLAYDLLGFHIHHHALNFLDSVSDALEARVDPERLAVDRAGHRTWVRHFPIGVDAEEIGALADSAEVRAEARELRGRLALDGVRLALGVDRMDYTKGVPERLEALEFLLETHPEWVGRLAYAQIGVPSRIELAEYREVGERTRAVAARINARFPRRGGATVHLIETHLDFRALLPWYRAADLCMVTALHDGMNLVAKEYVAARTDDTGALLLSPFTGAARELERAWIATPYDRDGLAATLLAALHEPAEAAAARMHALRETVQRWNIHDWAIGVLDGLTGLHLITPAPEPAPDAPTASVARDAAHDADGGAA
jgi:alpha,alpha-trehalose-phosphate synthase [UDP-forming]